MNGEVLSPVETLSHFNLLPVPPAAAMRTSTMAQWAIRGVVVVLQVEVRGCWQRFMHRPAGFVSRDTGLPPPQFWAYLHDYFRAERGVRTLTIASLMKDHAKLFI
jgi:hypothetical protein